MQEEQAKDTQDTSRLLVAGWSYTNACNLACRHCYNASGKRKADELTLEESFAVADKLKHAGVAAVNFGGGECALRPDFLELCSYLHDLGIKISYTTNGTTYKSFEHALHLFHDIGVSIDFADAERHDAFRGVPGTYRKAVECMESLVAAGMDTEMVTCLTSLNSSRTELEKMHSLAKHIGVDYWRLNRFREAGRGNDNKSSLALTREELRQAYKFLSIHIDPAQAVPEPLYRAGFGGYYTIPGDPSGYTAFRIQPNGEVTPSVFLSVSGGNIKDKSLEEILDSKIFREIRNRTAQGKCQTCTAYTHCRGGDAGASYLAYGHFNGPDPLCRLEPEDRKAASKQIIPTHWNVHELYLCTVYVPIRGDKHDRQETAQA